MCNKALWQQNSEMPRFPELHGDIKTDILIIGGGIAGILLAHFLHEMGADYILLEQNRICGGTTGNTTAKITLQHGLNYQKILRLRGTEIARGYLLANKKALEAYDLLCSEIDCDYTVKDNYVYSVDDRKKLERELYALDKIGCKACFCKDLPLPVKTVGAVSVAGQAQFNPLKFLSAVAGRLNIYENSGVCEMVGNTAVTEHGKIYADRVVVATHFPFLNKHGSYFLKLYQHRSYVRALENAADVNGMYVDESGTGLSFRNYGDLLLLGGGSHRTGKKGGGLTELRGARNLYYPASREAYSWATQDCMSLDSVPYIGKYSALSKNLYVTTGFNKWGMSGAMVAAQLLSDMLAEKKNEFTEVFNPSRSILQPQLLINGFEALTNLLTPTTKRCPHIGCALKWNSAEHSWDCPCHGSRFSESGGLLDGPATGDLNIK